MNETTEERVLATLARYRKSKELDFNEWEITPFKDAYAVSVADGTRPNWFYMVHGEDVLGFSLTDTTFAEAYASLVS